MGSKSRKKRSKGRTPTQNSQRPPAGKAGSRDAVGMPTFKVELTQEQLARLIGSSQPASDGREPDQPIPSRSWLDWKTAGVTTIVVALCALLAFSLYQANAGPAVGSSKATPAGPQGAALQGSQNAAADGTAAIGDAAAPPGGDREQPNGQLERRDNRGDIAYLNGDRATDTGQVEKSVDWLGPKLIFTLLAALVAFVAKFSRSLLRIGALERNAEKLSEKLDKLGEEISQHKSQIAVTEIRAQANDDQIEGLRTRLTGLDGRVRALGKRIDGLDTQAQAAEGHLHSINETMRALDRRVQRSDESTRGT